MARYALIAVCLLLAACVTQDPLTVAVPVYQRAEPPAELLAPLPAPTGVFVGPGATDAVACIAPAGKDALVTYIDALRQRLTAWQAWSQ